MSKAGRFDCCAINNFPKEDAGVVNVALRLYSLTAILKASLTLDAYLFSWTRRLPTVAAAAVRAWKQLQK